MIKVGIVGGTGYTGVELLRLLALHPDVELRTITSRADAGTPVSQMFPSLRGHVDLDFVHPDAAHLEQCDLVFFATPNGIAMKQAQALLDAGVRIIDLAADFRIKDIALWEKWYGMSHACPGLVAEAVYGLPEVNREKDQGRAVGGQSRMLSDGCAIGLHPAAGSRPGGHAAVDRGCKIRCIWRRTQGGNRFPVLRSRR